MMNTQPSHRDVSQGPATIRALSSITSEQASTIITAVQASGAWTAQPFDDYNGYLSILIEPSTLGDEKMFFISGTTHCIELVETKGDLMGSTETFANAEALQARLADIFPIQ